MNKDEVLEIQKRLKTGRHINSSRMAEFAFDWLKQNEEIIDLKIKRKEDAERALLLIRHTYYADGMSVEQKEIYSYFKSIAEEK